MQSNCGPLLFALKTEPLGFLLETDAGTEDARQFFFPLSRVAGQALILALCARPELAGDISPELQQEITGEIAAAKERDTEFLKTLGVSA